MPEQYHGFITLKIFAIKSLNDLIKPFKRLLENNVKFIFKNVNSNLGSKT